MLSLGYDQYVAQGGDWGSLISRMMGRHHHESGLQAVHVNLAFFDPLNMLFAPHRMLQMMVTWWSKLEFGGLMNGMKYVSEGNMYYRIQQTRPQTVAYCLEDSPVALLGWIWEKLIHWTDNYPWTDDEILTWISIYWFSTAGPGASVRIYFEAENPSSEFHGTKSDGRFWDYCKVPLGLTQFPKDIVGIPKVFTRTLGPVAFENWASDGGHFAAWERPEVLSSDLKTMFGKAVTFKPSQKATE
jgi:hypothetical protein